MKAMKMPVQVKTMTTKTEAKRVLSGLKKEIGDKFCDMTAAPVNGFNDTELKRSLLATVIEVWRESGLNLVLIERPKIAFTDRIGGGVHASPKNESAMRVMQILNAINSEKIKERRLKKEALQ